MTPVLFVLHLYVYLFSPPPVHLQLGPRTTVLVQPLHKDGTVDYVKALNQRLSKGVTPANNGYAIFAQIMPDKAWPSDKYRQRVFKMLGVPVPAKGHITFVPWEDYAKAHNLPYPYGPDPWNPFKHPVSTKPDSKVKQVWDNQGRAISHPWSAKAYPHVAAWLKLNEPALKEVVKALDKPKWYAPCVPDAKGDYPAMIQVLLPQLGASRQAGNLLCFRAELEIHNGDIHGAVVDLLRIKRLGGRVAGGPSLINRLVGISLDRMAGGHIRRLAESRKLTDAQARTIMADVRALPPLPTMASAIDAGERFMALDSVQWLWHGGHNPMQLLGARAKPGVRMLSNLGFDPNVPLRAMNQYYDALVAAAASKTYAQLERRTAALDGKLRAWSDSMKWMASHKYLVGTIVLISSAKEKRQFYTGVVTNMLFAVLVPALDAAYTTEWQCRQADELDMIALALAGYHAKHGKYPPSLAALVPGYFRKQPMDLFNGKPLHYQLKDGHITVYSVGPSLKYHGEKDDLHAGLVVRMK